MSIAVKICGITSLEAADATLRAGADYAGLVFFPRSPRNLDLEKARVLADRMRGRTRIVALFVDPKDSELQRVMKAVEPDLVQLHGKESPARTAEIKALTGRDVIKAFPVAEAKDASLAHAYDQVADFFMFEGRPPMDATRPGGIGAAFDWRILAGQTFARPWFLAGGLKPDNVARAIEVSGAERVDVSSGVEDSPGMKNPHKITAFVKAARGLKTGSAV